MCNGGVMTLSNSAKSISLADQVALGSLLRNLLRWSLGNLLDWWCLRCLRCLRYRYRHLRLRLHHWSRNWHSYRSAYLPIPTTPRRIPGSNTLSCQNPRTNNELLISGRMDSSRCKLLTTERTPRRVENLKIPTGCALDSTQSGVVWDILVARLTLSDDLKNSRQ